jgi:hypothetical protein
MPKVLVVIPEDLLRQVDDAARESETNRSAFICRSLWAHLRSERLRRLRHRIRDDAQDIARNFHEYWNPDDEPLWMAAENEALTRVEEGGLTHDTRLAGRPLSRAARSNRRQRTGRGTTRPGRSK